MWVTLSDFSKVRHTVDIFSIIQKHAIVNKTNIKTKIKKFLDTRWRRIVDTKQIDKREEQRCRLYTHTSA